MYFHKESTKIRNSFFLNRAISLWNDLQVEVKEEKSLKGSKAGLVGQEMFSSNAWGWWVDFILTSILLNNMYIYSYYAKLCIYYYYYKNFRRIFYFSKTTFFHFKFMHSFTQNAFIRNIAKWGKQIEISKDQFCDFWTNKY